MPDLIPSWMLDCLNTIRTWLKTSLVSEIVINDEGIMWKVRDE